MTHQDKKDNDNYLVKDEKRKCVVVRLPGKTSYVPDEYNNWYYVYETPTYKILHQKYNIEIVDLVNKRRICAYLNQYDRIVNVFYSQGFLYVDFDLKYPGVFRGKASMRLGSFKYVWKKYDLHFNLIKEKLMNSTIAHITKNNLIVCYESETNTIEVCNDVLKIVKKFHFPHIIEIANCVDFGNHVVLECKRKSVVGSIWYIIDFSKTYIEEISENILYEML